MQYLVKARFNNGESITFVSRDITEDDPFPDLAKNEYLYFDGELHENLFKELYYDIYNGTTILWVERALNYNSAHLVNFIVYARRPQAPEYVGLSAQEAATKALEADMSFRTVMENGVEITHEHDVSDKRVNVYLNNNQVYRAEIF